MESYKCMALSLILLLSTPLTTFCMEHDGDLDDSVTFGDASSSLIPRNTPPNTPDSLDDMPQLEDGDPSFYSVRPSIQYIGLEDFDKRSADLTQDQEFQALLLQIQGVNAPLAGPRVSNPELVLGAGALGVLANALTTAAPAVRGISIDSKSFGFSAGEAAWSILTKNGLQLATLGAILTIFFETRKTAQVEEKNKRLEAQLASYQKAVKDFAYVNKKHEFVEQGLIATEHKLLKNVHNHLCEEAQLIAKESAPHQAVATLKAILKNNQKITTKVVHAMADLEKIHTDSASLLKGEHYNILNPLGWFQALKNMCHKHAADAYAADVVQK